MINGFDLFEKKHFFDKTDYSSLEKNYDYIIPPILRVFDSTFTWKQMDFDDLTLYFFPALKYGNIEFHAKSMEKMIKFAVDSNDDDIIENKLISLASGFKNIYIGTQGNQKDKILLDDSGELVEIADNIFSFFLGVSANLVKTARTKEEYMKFKEELGFEGEELLQEGEDWEKYNKA